MLNLPIRSRASSNAGASAAPAPGAPLPENAGGQDDVASKASEGSPDDKMAGSGPGSGSMKVTVKNTFIDIAEPDGDQTPAAIKASTCTARLSGAYPVGFGPEASPVATSVPTSAPPTSAPPPPPPAVSESVSEVDESPASALNPAVLPELPVVVRTDKHKLSIKNTFIELEEEGDTGRFGRYTQSCTAAMFENTPDSFNFQQDSFNLDAMGDPSQGSRTSAPPARLPIPAKVPMETHLEDSPSDAPASKQTGLKLSVIGDGQPFEAAALPVKNTFIDFEDGNQTPLSYDRYTQSCTARMSGPPPMLFPPTPQKIGGMMESFSEMGSTMAPLPEGDEVTAAIDNLPDPLRLTVMDSPVGMSQFIVDEPAKSPASLTHSPSTKGSSARTSPTSPPPPPPPAYAAPEATELGSQSMPPPPLLPADSANVSGYPHGDFNMPGAEIAGLGYPQASSLSPVMPPSMALQPPSVGSALHGTIGPDGQPACKPCAWFYKEGSCTNASACGYCHLCPQGELKNRKKAKIANLRRIEAAQAAAEAANSPKEQQQIANAPEHSLGSASPGSNKSAGSGGPKKVFLLSSLI